jgi:hypothetical protein
MPLRSAGLPPTISVRDIRTPADPADKQTTDAKSALPPVEFTAVKGSLTNNLTITDRQNPPGRAPTVSYRIYFLPAAFAASVSNTATRMAGSRVATLVVDLPAPGLGTTLPFSDPKHFGQAGNYYCIGVNRLGIQAPPENTVVAP